MAVRLAGITAESGAISFADVPSDYWASGYITAAVNAGYVSGYSDGTFRPDAPITRAEAGDDTEPDHRLRRH